MVQGEACYDTGSKVYHFLAETFLECLDSMIQNRRNVIAFFPTFFVVQYT